MHAPEFNFYEIPLVQYLYLLVVAMWWIGPETTIIYFKNDQKRILLEDSNVLHNVNNIIQYTILLYCSN